MIAASDVSAVVVTRGDVSLAEVLEPLAVFREVLVWDNSCEADDLAVYGRYAALERTVSPVVFVQDDDCVVHPSAITELLANYRPGAVTANMPEAFRHDFYRDHCLVGFGAVFDRDLPRRAFDRFHAAHRLRGNDPFDGEPWLRRTCDVVFTALTPRVLVAGVYRDLPWAHADNRMWRQQEHVGERKRMLELVRRIRDQAAA